MNSSKTQNILAGLGAIFVLWLAYHWYARSKWEATRESVLKEHLGECITPDTLKEIDKETSDIIQEGRDRDRD